jgi:histidinol-phosphate aminotransferase
MTDVLRPNRRTLLRNAGVLAAAGALLPRDASPAMHDPGAAETGTAAPLRLSLNENPYGPSPSVAGAVAAELPRLCRYADPVLADTLTEAVARYERVAPEQIVLGEILTLLGLFLGQQGGPGGEFIYSVPGFMALVDAAAHVGGRGVGVPLNARGENDLPALLATIGPRTRAMYLVNPHNPTGTVSATEAWIQFLREASRHTLVIVDEAYLEYTPEFPANSAAALTREGANVMVFRTFDKIHGLAGLPIGYVLAPRALADALKKQGAGDAEALGRLNIIAARTALADTGQVERVRATVAKERAQWIRVLDDRRLKHTEAQASFVFFDTGHPHDQFAAEMLKNGVDIGRAHPPFATWARITIGLPEENVRCQQALGTALASLGRSSG